MGWGKIRGAPRRLPVDRNDLFTPIIDVAARTAWLLRVSRFASAWGDQTADAFGRRLAEVGLPVSHSSLISQWESGRTVQSLSLVAAYERALWLAQGELLGAVGSMQQSSRVSAGERPEQDRESRWRELSRLDDRIEDGRASGRDWLALATLLTDQRNAPPPEGLIRRWTYELTIDMLRSGHFDYSTRWSAISVLISDPLYADAVEREVIAAAAEAGAPLARNAWDALSQSGRHGAAGGLINRLSLGNYEQLLGLSIGLATMIGRKQLSHTDVGQLQHKVRELLADGDDAERELAFMLAGRLGRSTMTSVSYPRNQMWNSRTFVEHPPHLEEYLAAAREASGIEDDLMLRRLLQEALSGLWVEKRQLAHQLIGASPYRDAIARTAVQVATTSPEPHARHAAALLLRQTAPDDRTQLTRLLHCDDQMVVRLGIVAVGRGGDHSAVDMLGTFLDDETTRADALLARNMLGRADDPRTTQEQGGERWWATHGRRQSTPGTRFTQ